MKSKEAVRILKRPTMGINHRQKYILKDKNKKFKQQPGLVFGCLEIL